MYLTLKRKGYLREISTFRPYVARLKKAVPHEININRRIIQKVLWEDEPSNKPLLIKILDIHPFLKVLNELVRSKIFSAKRRLNRISYGGVNRHKGRTKPH